MSKEKTCKYCPCTIRLPVDFIDKLEGFNKFIGDGIKEVFKS